MNQDNATSAGQKARESRENGFGGAILCEISTTILNAAYTAIENAGGHIDGTTANMQSLSVNQKGPANIDALVNKRILKLTAAEGVGSIGNAQITLFDLRGRMLFNKELTFTDGSAEIALPQTIRNKIVALQITGQNGLVSKQKIKIDK